MNWVLFLIFLATTGVAAASGVLFKPGAWYAALNKPGWTPPNWMFPTVWTLLYLLMAIAAARVASVDGASVALALWALQIALNTLWTPVFFGLHRIGAGLVILALLWCAVAATLIAFWSLDAVAGWMFLPYLAWVTVAGALNWSVLRLNPD